MLLTYDGYDHAVVICGHFPHDERSHVHPQGHHYDRYNTSQHIDYLECPAARPHLAVSFAWRVVDFKIVDLEE